MITLILHPQPKAAPARRKKTGRPMTAKEALRAKAAKRSPGVRARVAAESADQPAGADDAGSPPLELSEQWLTADADSAPKCAVDAGPAATKLIRAWQKQANAEAIAAVAYGQASESSAPLPGAVRKAARRALHVLKSRGVAVPERRAEAASPARVGLLGEREPEPLVATFVPPDSNGMTFFSISQRLVGGRHRVADVVIRTELGILHASSGKLAGKQIRRWRQRVESRLGTSPVTVPLDWARYRIAQARQQNETSGQLLPLGLDSCASLFEPVPETEPEHPVADLETELGEAEVAAARADSEQLQNEPEFRSWLLERHALDEMLRNVGTRVGAAGAEDRALVDKVLDEEMASATDRHFTPEVRSSLADRMRDAAVSIRERADDQAARRVLCVAKAVREAGLITSPPSELPFLIGFFRKAVAMLAQQGEGRLQVPVPAAAPIPGGETPAEPDASAQPTTK